MIGTMLMVLVLAGIILLGLAARITGPSSPPISILPGTTLSPSASQ